MADKPLPLAVIIVNYNAGGALATLLDKLNGHCAQLLLVDNASSDDSLKGVREIAAVELIQNPENRGYAVAVNQALQGVRQPWVLLLNPDCELQPEVLRKLMKRMENSPCAAAGVRVVNPDGSEQRASRRNLPTFSRLWRELLGLDQGVNLRGPVEGIQTVEAVSGAFVCLKTSVIQALGGLDEGYFLHCEDLDLFARLKAAGHCVQWHGDLQVMHRKGTAACAKATVERHKHAGMLRYFNRHMADDWPWGLRSAARAFIQLHGLWVALKLRLGWQGVRR